MTDFYSQCCTYLLPKGYEVNFNLDTNSLTSNKKLPLLWERILKLTQYDLGNGFSVKGDQYLGWTISRMAVKAALETNDLHFLSEAAKILIGPYISGVYEVLNTKFSEDLFEYTCHTFGDNSLIYHRTSLFVSKIEDHRTVLATGIFTGIEGSKQYVEVSYTSPLLWDYYFSIEITSPTQILNDPSYSPYKNLLETSLKAVKRCTNLIKSA